MIGIVLLMLGGLSVFVLPCVRAGEAARWPQEGDNVQVSGNLVLDVSHVSQGYFLARVYEPADRRLKLRVVTGQTTLDYDLPQTAEYIVVPLQMGSGTYEVTLYENTSGKSYMETGSISFYAELEREDAAFLYPNQYVDYTAQSPAVTKSDELRQGRNDREFFDASGEFIISEFAYDFIKALTVKPGVLPQIDECYEERLGVCQDLSAILCCMLRVQGIPARLVIGYADEAYHAWVVAEIDGQEVFYDPTVRMGAMKEPSEYSVERYY